MASSGKEDEEKTKPEGQKDGRTGDKMIDDAVDKMLPIFLEDGVIDHTDPINDTYFKEIVDVAGPMLVPGLGQPDPEKAVDTAHKYKAEGNRLFRLGDYSPALRNYQYSLKLFQLCSEYYPQVHSECVLLMSNMSAAYCRLAHYCESIRLASECLAADKNFFKAYYRRAEACKTFGMAVRKRGKHDPTEILMTALKDYCKCYKKMVDKKDTQTRMKQFCEAVALAVDLSCTKDLPEFHEQDKSTICSRILENIVVNFESAIAQECLDFLLFTKSGVPKSGLATRYPCNASSVPFRTLLEKGLLNLPILELLTQWKLIITQGDLKLAVEYIPEKDLDLLKRLLTISQEQSSFQNDSETLDESLKCDKPVFAVFLITQGAIPTKAAALNSLSMIQSDPAIMRVLMKRCTPVIRAEVLVTCLVNNEEKYADDAIDSGPIDSCAIDLARIMTSKLLLNRLDYVSVFINSGASPNGIAGNVTPIAAVLRASQLPRRRQVDIVSILLDNGADIKNLSSAYQDPMSPVHVATKLALETGNIAVLETTCTRYQFPENGRLVDKFNRTPLHISMMCNNITTSTKVLLVLTQYNIDKSLRDDTLKRAEDYMTSKSEDNRRTLVAYIPSEAQRKEELRSSKKLSEEEEEARQKIDHRPADQILLTAREMKRFGNNYFTDKQLENAIHAYSQSVGQYDIFEKKYPEEFAELTEERAVLYCNLALTLFKMGHYADSANVSTQALALNPNSYKAYFRRAEATRMRATQLQTHMDMYDKAMADYAKTYCLMSDPKSINFRVERIVDIIKMGLERDCIRFLPLLHECDKPRILTQIIKQIKSLQNDHTPKDICYFLECILVRPPVHFKSGLGTALPCDTSCIAICDLIPAVSHKLLKALLSNGCSASPKDLKVALNEFTKDHVDHVYLIVENIANQPDYKERLDLNSLCIYVADLQKLYFIPVFISLGARPSPSAILEKSEFQLLEPLLAIYVGENCSVHERTKLLCLCLNSDCKDHISILLKSGEIESINLCEYVTVPIILTNPDILGELIKSGISPNGQSPTSNPISVVFSSKLLSLLQQTRLVETLLVHGAHVDSVCQAYEEQMSPVHAATKLALETGNLTFLDVVCSKTVFPPNGRLVDKNSQTPLHIVMRTKPTERTVQVCEVLCKYHIDPLCKDQWNKIAQDYSRNKSDKRIPHLKKVARLIEERLKNHEFGDVVDEEEKSKKKKKKKKKKGKKDIEEIEEKEEIDGLEEEVKPVTKPTQKPVKPVLDIYTLLKSLMSHSNDYFQPMSASTLQTDYQKQEESEDKDVAIVEPWLMEEIVSEGRKGGSWKDHKGRYGIGDESEVVVRKKPSSSPIIDDQPWEVECTEKVLRFLKEKRYPLKIKMAAVNTICSIATGRWSAPLSIPVGKSRHGTLFEAKLTQSSGIIWEVAVQFSSVCTSKAYGNDEQKRSMSLTSKKGGPSIHIFTEVIRVWDIVSDEDVKELCLRHIARSHQRGAEADLNLELVLQGFQEPQTSSKREKLPRRFLLSYDGMPGRKSSNALEKFAPAASIKDDEFNVITFYPFTSTLVSSMLNADDIRRDFPFKEWPKEHDIINMPQNREAVLLLGRSGTGKTTCCLYRLWYQFLNYWEQASTIGPWHPRRPFMMTYSMGEVEYDDEERERGIEQRDGRMKGHDKMFSDDVHWLSSSGEKEFESNQLEHLHQVLITKNYVLCAQMKRRFYDLAASHQILKEHMDYENKPTPIDLASVHNKAFPLFLTARQFLLLIDASIDVGQPFFDRNKDGSLAIKITSSDYDHEDPDTLLDLEESEDEDEDLVEDNAVLQQPTTKAQTRVWREVTASYFVNEIWPKICRGSSNRSIDPLLIWMEIKSFIKGSAQAVESKEGCLTQKEYEILGKKMASNFAGSREEVYKIFQHYQEYLHKKRHLNLFDECELVHSVYQRLSKLKTEPQWSIHHFYVDEVQDFTQAELSIFLRCCREPNGIFLTGDTAQSIMRGISFRFRDLRSLFHYASENASRAVHPIKIAIPRIHELTINFRSHSGVLQLATSIIDLLKEYFQNSFDLLPEDHGMFPGPRPVFLQSCQVSDLALLLQSNKRASSTIEFGAHQVIIVQNDEAKRNLPEALKAGVVLTVFEAKGLEFDDVLLYNFFSDSLINKEWRVVTTYADKKYTQPVTNPHTRVPLEARPRPLEFDEQAHKSLNSELKYLYTAITRAKCNLWIYDSSETRRLPMFDYWVRRGLVRVVRLGETEEDDSVLFTATSTPEQWQQQGDYFRRKGLWEPAMKCYHKSGSELQEREAEAYLYAQKARESKNLREVIGLFENAAVAFLCCDRIKHDVKFLNNAAKCLKNSKRHSDAARLFEKLGQRELAKKGYIRAKDHESVARLRIEDGDFSGAVRMYTRANKRLESLEIARGFERDGHVLQADVSSFQLANQYAKFFVGRRDEANLKKVLSYISDVILRVAHLKKGKFYTMALDEYIEAGQLKNAERLILAQEMYDRGLILAHENGTRKLEYMFLLHKVTAAIYKMNDQKSALSDDITSILTELSNTSELTIKAKALLLIGMTQNKSAACREALGLYDDQGSGFMNSIGSLESFNQMLNIRKDLTLSMVVNTCLHAKEISESFKTNSASRVQNIKHALEFYHLRKLEDVYLMPRSQDIWVGTLRTVAMKDCPLDEDGMMRLDATKVHSLLVERYGGFVSEWVKKFELGKKIKGRLSAFPFHKEVSEKGYIKRYLAGYPAHRAEEYISVISIVLQAIKVKPGIMEEKEVERIIPRLFSPFVSLCLPISKQHRYKVERNPVICESLDRNINFLVQKEFLLKPDVDELFEAWRCWCFVRNTGELEKHLEDFAAKHGSGTPEQQKTKVWLVHDKKTGVHHYFFVFWLKACHIIRSDCQVIGSMKLIFNYFLTIIARRSTLRRSISIMNFTNVATLCSTALFGLLSVAKPEYNLFIPVFYKYECQLFDDLNIQGAKQFWLLTACVEQVRKRKSDGSITKLCDESKEFLTRILSLLLGSYNQHFHVLKYALGRSTSWEDGSLLHCLVLILVLVANVRILSHNNVPFISECISEIITQVEKALTSEEKSKLPSYLTTVRDKLSSATSVDDIFAIVQILLSQYNFPSNLAKLVPARNGNMDFKEMALPPELCVIKLNPKVTSPSVPDSSGASAIQGGVQQHVPPHQEVPTSKQQTQTSATPQLKTVNPELQQQLMFVLQQIQQYQQYQIILSQQMSQLQQTSAFNMTPQLQQRLNDLKQQYFQVIQAQQQLQLQQQQINFKMLQQLNDTSNSLPSPSVGSQGLEHDTSTVGSQRLLSDPFTQPTLSTQASLGKTLNDPFSTQAKSIWPTSNSMYSSLQGPLYYSESNSMTGIPGSEPKDGASVDQAGRKDCDDDTLMFYDDEIEQLLATDLTQPDVFVETKSTLPVSTSNEDMELVDQHYCQVCGVSFKPERKGSVIEDEELGLTTAGSQKYEDHIYSASHKDNLFAYKKYIAVKTQHFDELRNNLEKALEEASLQDAVDIERFVVKVKSDMRNFDQKMEEYKDKFSWKKAHSEIFGSLEVMQSQKRQLMKLCALESIKNPQIPVSSIVGDNVDHQELYYEDEEEIEFDEEIEITEATKQKSRDKKRQRKLNKK